MQEKQEQDYLKQRKKLLIKLEEMDVYMLLSLRWAIIDKTASEIPLNQACNRATNGGRFGY